MPDAEETNGSSSTSRDGETLSASALRYLKQTLKGNVLSPEDAGFFQAQRIYNGAIKKNPAVIVQSADRDDLIQVVRFARTHGIPLSVKGRGHSIAGHALCDHGIVLDLARMDRVFVDPVRRKARVEGGTNWQTFDRATQQYGLATTGGSYSSTGVAGVTLGGGLGWLAVKYGLACDNLLAVDLITADGQSVRASATQHADLFWGLRGGGGNFGIATRLEFQLHEVRPPLVGKYVYPLKTAQKVFDLYRLLTEERPDDLACGIAFTPLDGKTCVTIAFAYFGERERERELSQIVATVGSPLHSQICPLSYCQLQSLSDDSMIAGLPSHWKSGFLPTVSDEAVEAMLYAISHAPSNNIQVYLDRLHGVACHIGPEETAFAHRDPTHCLLINSRWFQHNEREAAVRGIEEFFLTMQPFLKSAVYVNFLGEEGQQRIIDAYGEPHYQRLVALKNRYDPTNFFCFNQNILPGN